MMYVYVQSRLEAITRNVVFKSGLAVVDYTVGLSLGQVIGFTHATTYTCTVHIYVYDIAKVGTQNHTHAETTNHGLMTADT